MFGGVGALVELAGKVFNRKEEIVVVFWEGLFVNLIHRGLRKNGDFGVLIGGIGHVLDVVAYQHTHFVGLDAEVVLHFIEKLCRTDSVIVFFFYVNAPYFHGNVFVYIDDLLLLVNNTALFWQNKYTIFFADVESLMFLYMQSID